MQYENAHIHQLEALIACRLDYLAAAGAHLTQEDKMLTQERLETFFSAHLDKDFFVYTATDAGEIVSCAMMMVYERPFRPDLCTSAKIGVVYNVMTKEAYRGQGLATKVVEMLLADAKEKGLETVMLNATKAGMSIYKRLGFAERCYNEANMVYDIE